MLLTILGWFWVITGIIFLMNPDRLRRKLQRKSFRKIKLFFFWIALALGLLLIKATWGVEGTLAKILMLIGFIGLFKAVFFLKAEAADAVIEWFIDRPVKFFRMWAIGQIVFGAVLLSV